MAAPGKSETLCRIEIGNEQFRILVEASPFGILIADSEERIAMVNLFAADLFDYSRDELLGLNLAEVIEGGLPAPARRLDLISGLGAGTTHAEGRARRRDGSFIPVEMALSPLPSGGRLYVLATVTDITERRDRESQLAFFAEVMERLYEAVLFLDDEGRVCFWNSGAASMFGVTEEEAMGCPADEIIRWQSELGFREDLLPEVKHSGRFERELQCFSKETVSKRLFIKGAPITWGDQHGSMWLANDVTREARLEAEIVKIAENEQRRIGEDLHDDLCSQLSAIGCLVEVLAQGVSDSDSNEAHTLAKVAEMVCAAGETAREIAAGLTSAVIKREGFVGAVRELAERRRPDPSKECFVRIEDEALLDQLDDEKATHLYRIIQEAMSNAFRHGHAARVQVNLSADQSSIRLQISDDGGGFEPGTETSGLGLLTMSHRASLMGGTCEISSSLQEGTLIDCVVPFHH